MTIFAECTWLNSCFTLRTCNKTNLSGCIWPEPRTQRWLLSLFGLPSCGRAAEYTLSDPDTRAHHRKYQSVFPRLFAMSPLFSCSLLSSGSLCVFLKWRAFFSAFSLLKRKTCFATSELFPGDLERSGRGGEQPIGARTWHTSDTNLAIVQEKRGYPVVFWRRQKQWECLWSWTVSNVSCSIQAPENPHTPLDRMQIK